MTSEPASETQTPSPILARGPRIERPPLNRSFEIEDANGSFLRTQTLSMEEVCTSTSSTAPRASRRAGSIRARSPLGGGTSTDAMSNAMASALATAALSTERCPWCQGVLETHDETTAGLSLVCLATFVHREPGLAAPFLLDMLMVASRIATATQYAWQKSQCVAVHFGAVVVVAAVTLMHWWY